MSNELHKQHAMKVSCAVVTVSDTRNEETDKSGKLMKALLEESGHEINYYTIIPDDKETITNTMEHAVQLEDIDAVLVNGGTGISGRDVTIEAIQPLLDKELPGYGELFRYLSYQYDIGTASMLSRAIAGVVNNRIIFATPGSTGAVKLAMERLILPELVHAVKEITKDLLK
ncbi:molybdenum cofactor biosynthesis protein [Oceanobacillus sp. 143]|uniref:Molybdenum cofactor biosynthesis protein B n=1 Tax=Oceanobacillus zhaokaii TaxID=2052660 RepID=A0A345PK38_9BACI|nr:MogA/MoaB family molybdenum cofactor biosynthesis protein [Oceanobacillus zhaokaii]AXI10368.1 molybdenum cofactor biosynthesis protein [Oceanobacillus zhaokaii]QGS69413.1 molybdenum cofactor biosynthesis protein [Oceanobacillus sp. 143]